MKYFRYLLFCLLISSTISCSKDIEDLQPDVKIESFVGSWKATSFVLTNNLNSSEEIDLIANGGEIRFTVLPGGKIRTWFTFGTFSDEWDALSTINGNTITSNPTESGQSVKMSTFIKDGNKITMTNKSESFDFSLMGADEVAATSVGIYERQ